MRGLNTDQPPHDQVERRLPTGYSGITDPRSRAETLAQCLNGVMRRKGAIRRQSTNEGLAWLRPVLVKVSEVFV